MNRFMKQTFWTLFIGIIFGTACSAEQDPEIIPTLFTVNLSVADSLDSTGNFAGFNVLVYSKRNTAAAADTIFFGTTDTSGVVSGSIKLGQEGAFPAQISRNGVNLAAFRIILAEGDSVYVSGEFPSFQETYTVDSREARAMKRFDRVESGFERTNRFILAGQVADSLIPYELQKWVDLYWQVFNENKGTVASKFSLESAINLLNRFDKQQMLQKLNQSFSEELAYGLAITVGKDYVAEQKGIEKSIVYLDSVKSLTKKKEIERAVEQSVIKLNYDSSRVETAVKLLNEYNSKYNKGEVEPSFWYKNMRFELTYLAPGMQLPPFRIETTEGDTVTNESMLGSPYILEFTLMANQLYQQQYDEATLIYQLYESSGLEYFTIPFDQSTNTIVAFFQERDRYWALAEPSSFAQKEFIEDFNIQYFPTRILVNKEGKIVRKYVGEEFEGMIPAITQTLK